MKKDGDNLIQKSKTHNQITQLADKQLEHQILIFTTYIKRSPKSIQNHLAPYILQLHKMHPQDEKLKELAQLLLSEDVGVQFSQASENLMKIYHRLLQLKLLFDPLFKNHQKISKEKEISKSKQRKKENDHDKGINFKKMQLLCPHYDVYYRMSKQQRDNPLPEIKFNNPEVKDLNFYAEPRFLVKISQFVHYKQNEKLKGNVLFLQYQGNLIEGRQVYGITKDNSVSVWQIQSKEYPNIDINKLKSKTNSLDTDDEYKGHRMKLQRNHVYNEHLQRITSVSFSLDQLYLISGSHDRTIKLWCLRSKSCICTFKGHLKVVWSVCFSQSGYYLLSGSADGMMMLWCTSSARPKKSYYHKKDIYKVSFSKNPQYVISAGEDCSIKIWHISKAELVQQIKLNKPIINFTLGFSGSYIISTERDGKITILNMRTGELYNNFYFYQDKLSSEQYSQEEKQKMFKLKIHDVCLSEDESELACVSSKYVIIYDMKNLKVGGRNNMVSIFQNSIKEKQLTVSPKEIIYMGIDNNLTFCRYQAKNLLVVAGSK